jgi:ABC-type amino acid transport substrate-binding protein
MPTPSSRKAPTSLSNQLHALEKSFGGTERLIQVLRRAPGMEKIHRSTIHRWKNATKPGVKIDSGKLAEAVEFLAVRKNETTLSLALPDTLQILPVLLLLWDDVHSNANLGVRKKSPYGLLKRLGVNPIYQWCAGGRAALALLQDRRKGFDIAFAAREFGGDSSLEEEYFRVCGITVSQWSGVARTELSDVFDLAGKRVGFNPKTAIPAKLSQLEAELKIQVERVAAEDSGELARALRDERIDVVLGWEPLLSEIRTSGVSDDVPIKSINFLRSDLIRYAVEVDLFVQKAARPDAVRIFLDALDESNTYVSDPDHHEEIARVCEDKVPRRWRLSRRMVLETLNPKTSTFEIRDLDQKVARYLWKGEIEQLKASTA